MQIAHKITPCLWFDDQAEEAAHFYTSIFKDSKITNVSRHGEAGKEIHGKRPGSAMMVAFELAGQSFTALNGGPQFKFSEAVSLIVSCESQAEVDYFWARLSEGGAEGQCGWLKDRFSFSWQIVPAALPEVMTDPDPARSQRAMQAMFKMKKLDIAALERAAAGK